MKEFRVTVEVAKDRPVNDKTGEGWHIRETWYDQPSGEDLSPKCVTSIVYRHPITNISVWELHMEKGKLHRYALPAVIERDPFTSQILNQWRFHKGHEVDRYGQQLPKRAHDFGPKPVPHTSYDPTPQTAEP